MSAHPIQVQEEGAADLVAEGSVSTFRLWVERKVIPPGTKIGKYRYWLVSDLISATEKLHHFVTRQPKGARYGNAQKQARRASRAG